MSGLSDQEFQAWLEAVERDEEVLTSLPPDDAADLGLARHLLSLRAVPSSGLTATVERRLTSGSAEREPFKVPGWQGVRVGVGIAVALLIVFTLGFTPAGTWAQGMLQRFGVTFLPGALPQWSEGLPEITPTRSPVAFTSEREIQAAAEFPLHWPRDFPFDRDQVTFLGYIAYTEDGAWIESVYGDVDQRDLEVQVFWQQRPGPWPVGDARFESVTVAGVEGLWGEGVPASLIAGARSSLILKGLDGTVKRVGSSDRSSLNPINVLLWEEGEILYVLIDPNQQFGRADLLRTAESAYEDR